MLLLIMVDWGLNLPSFFLLGMSLPKRARECCKIAPVQIRSVNAAHCGTEKELVVEDESKELTRYNLGSPRTTGTAPDGDH